jgi:hypothetical protein
MFRGILPPSPEKNKCNLFNPTKALPIKENEKWYFRTIDVFEILTGSLFLSVIGLI